MVYNRYSNSMDFDGITCNWDTLASVKPYNNINNMGTALAQEQVGRFVYELGKSNNIHVRDTLFSYQATIALILTISLAPFMDMHG